MAQSTTHSKRIDPFGLLIGWGIIALWFLSLSVWLQVELNWFSAWTYLGVLVQMHLYTGLFITAHDAMHGIVSKNKQWNFLTGWVAAILFSYNFYTRLFPRHHAHHRHVATEEDPDFHPSGKFWPWYYSFITQYITIWQILLMAITFNLLKLVLPTENLIMFWILPALLSTLQLFYFGTYLPHRGKPSNTHHSSSQPKNHLWSFLSCYFFGYHWEHHDSPGTPWWKLWQLKP